VAAEAVTMGWDGVRLTMRTLADTFPLRLPLLGLYNVYNALAAAAAALTIGAPLSALGSALEGFTAAFGRQEALRVRGREVRLFLCKNPAGTNQVLRTLLGLAEATDGAGYPGPAGAPLHLLLVLNDDVADGRDVSWIWDVDFELLAGRTGTLVAAGTRAADLALRLKYAGLERGLALEPELRAAVGRALTRTPPGERLYILPTYTAMLAVREHLAALAGERHYWEQ
jgi:UDP-N-acetylmuramyl tripeptide synthase